MVDDVGDRGFVLFGFIHNVFDIPGFQGMDEVEDIPAIEVTVTANEEATTDATTEEGQVQEPS